MAPFRRMLESVAAATVKIVVSHNYAIFDDCFEHADQGTSEA
jgi:hypothetical protein